MSFRDLLKHDKTLLGFNKSKKNPDNFLEYVDWWSKYYNTRDEASKEIKFAKDVKRLYNKAPADKKIKDSIDIAYTAFQGDKGLSESKLKELIYMIALHESAGGKYIKQKSGGPARGYWQVEIPTAKSLVKSKYFGKKAQELVGKYKDEIDKMSSKEFERFIEKPLVNAVLAFTKVIQSGDANNSLSVLQ